MLRAASSGAPAAERAESLTISSTTAPYGSGEAGRNTRTESFSANDTLPVTGWPLAVTTHARFVLLRSIDSVNRTESTEPRSTLAVLLIGRKRTTAGAEVVVMVKAGVSATGAPDASSSGPSPTEYGVSVARTSDGVKT